MFDFKGSAYALYRITRSKFPTPNTLSIFDFRYGSTATVLNIREPDLTISNELTLLYSQARADILKESVVDYWKDEFVSGITNTLEKIAA